MSPFSFSYYFCKILFITDSFTWLICASFRAPGKGLPGSPPRPCSTRPACSLTVVKGPKPHLPCSRVQPAGPEPRWQEGPVLGVTSCDLRPPKDLVL